MTRGSEKEYTERVVVQLKPEEKTAIVRYSETSGISISEIMRRAVKLFIQKKVK